MSENIKLLDREELLKMHPALAKGYRLNWLIRTRQIPIVKIGRRIFFDEKEILEWISKHSIPADEGNIK